MSSALYLVLLFSALWTLSFCWTRQFYVVNEKKTWTDAQKYCRENFTDLATIESQEEMNALLPVLNGKTGYFWIGLRQKENANNTCFQGAPAGLPMTSGVNRCWTWSDGSYFSYSKWNSGEPNNAGTDNCGDLRSANRYRWNDGLCSYTNQFVCYNKIPLILIHQKKTWREALSYCRENHVDLVSVHTKEIQHWVEKAVYYASTANVWMGLRHTCAQSFWFWVSGSTMCYQNWAPGNGTGVEDCSGGERTGAVQSGSKQWVSLPEDHRLNFICTLKET
ncbi:macrophage mannose receptor 1-like [Pygocentrus nattereri]|uniref:macrophage mannose receptor 1-like n=1 Tax=Pygocentrus nattereri TaxID=42514 RepID=UPI001890E788|nr:macrophage mannose receptor 1-like [Pygocentrus nattereri]